MMLLVETSRLTIALAFALLALLAPAVTALAGDHAFWPGLWPQVVVPFALLAEMALHFLLLSSQRQVRSVVPAFVGAVALILVRAIGCLTGALAVWLAQRGPAGYGLDVLFVDFWMGSPAVIALQLLVLLAVLPIALRHIAPGFLSQGTLTWLSASSVVDSRSTGDDRRTPMALEPAADPINGNGSHPRPFIYSFPELDRYLDKVVGLEGHLLLSDEGLVMWSRLPWHAEPEDLGAALVRWMAGASVLTAPSMPGPRPAMVHSGDHWIVSVPLREDATAHLFFTERLTASQIAPAALRAAEAVRSLFNFRLAKGAPRASAASNLSPR
jgi:predicted regulator of Ras-like GTPase activity (Roadblock/LC7/MglB family)